MLTKLAPLFLYYMLHVLSIPEADKELTWYKEMSAYHLTLTQANVPIHVEMHPNLLLTVGAERANLTVESYPGSPPALPYIIHLNNDNLNLAADGAQCTQEAVENGDCAFNFDKRDYRDTWLPANFAQNLPTEAPEGVREVVLLVQGLIDRSHVY